MGIVGNCGAGSGSWDTVGDEDGSSVGGMISKQPFYSSGPNAEFTMINGGYQPTINMEVLCCPS